MKTLYILRHAQSGHENGVRDEARTLDETGRNEARSVAAKMHAAGYRPEKILCSSAQRTRETAIPVLERWDDVDISYEEALYLAPAGDLYERVKDVPAEVESVLLIGHNPGMHALAVLLVGGGDPGMRMQIAGGYKTGCLCKIDFNVDSWADVMPASGMLADLLFGEKFA